MLFNLGITVFVFLLTAKARGIKADQDDDKTEHNNQQFYVDQHQETREKVKLELYGLFERMTNTLNMKFAALESKMEMSLAKLEEKCNKKQTASQFENANITSLLSESFNGRLSKVFVELGKKIEVIERSQKQFPCNQSETFVGNEGSSASLLPSELENQTDVSTSTQTPPNQEGGTIVEELVGKSGTIEFDGREHSNLSRKIWTIAARENEYFNVVSFVLEENSLGSSAHLTLWDFGYGVKHVYNGSQTDWREQRTFTSVDLIVVTLAMGNSTLAPITPSFKLKFTVTRKRSDWKRFTEVMTKPGHQPVSYPPQNKHNYTPGDTFYALMAPPNVKPFRLTMTYMDVSGYLPRCMDARVKIWLLQELPSETNFVVQNSFSRCGRLGNISEFIGEAAVAFVRFSPPSIVPETGRGFRLEVDNLT